MMKRNRLHVYLITALVCVGALVAGAQSVFKMPERKAGNSSDLGKQKCAAVEARKVAENFASGIPLMSNADLQQVEKYVEKTGSAPEMPKAPVMRAGNSGKTYNYVGFNAYAGTTPDGQTTGGLCDFNISPFECDTVSSHSGLSPYSYVKGNVLNCYLPIREGGVYTKLQWTSYNANTLEALETATVDLTVQNMSYCPYLMCYDDKRDAVYVISLLTGQKDQDGISFDEYFLNILDENTHQLKRLCKLGDWRGDRKSGNFNPKGFAGANSNLYILNSDGDKLHLEQLMPQYLLLNTTDENQQLRKYVGYTQMPTEYLFGFQPMIYDANSGKLTVMHYDMTNGTEIYTQNTFAPYGASDKVCESTLVEKLPTGFTFFYQRPVVNPNGLQYIDRPTDLEITADNENLTYTISFTLPTTVDGGKAPELPSYNTNKKCRAYIYLDGNYAATTNPTQPEMGEKVTATIPNTVLNMKPGPHAVTLQIDPINSSVLGGFNMTEWANLGYDTPGDVVNPTLLIANNKATIKWEAPAKGQFADFGMTYDPSDITYTVTRDFDGKVIAENITATQCEDTDISAEIKSYTYTISAKSHDVENKGTVTPRVTYGEYATIPYNNQFASVSDTFGWSALNVNNDGTMKTWNWNSYQQNMSCSGTNSGTDDWLFSPALKMEADKLYEISFDCAMGYWNQYRGWETLASLKVTMGEGNTIAAQDIELADLDKKGFNMEPVRLYVRPSKAGNYNLGFHDYGNGESPVTIDNLMVREIAPAAAPAQVRSLKITPDANGALGATLTFTLPSTDISGKSISTLSKVTAYDLEGNVMAEKSAVKPGQEVSLAVAAENDDNRYFVVAANEQGEGWPAEVRSFIGPDVPKPITNLKATWGDSKNEATFSWTNPTEGVNGGYVNPADFTYTLYRVDNTTYPPYIYLGETKADDGTIEMSMMDLPEGQDLYPFALTAKNEKGESEHVRVGIVLGDPYKLPFVDPFRENGLDHQPYITKADENGSQWSIDMKYFNSNVEAYDYKVNLCANNRSDKDGIAYFMSPIIDFAGATTPVFDLWLHHTPQMDELSYFKVVASVDGSSDYVDICEPVKLTGNNGWQLHSFDLSSLKGKKAQIGLCAYMSNPAIRIFADSWNIHEASGNDLAITGISQPLYPKAGQEVEVKVTVANLGATTAKDFSVMFNLDDNTIAETEAKEALAPGKSTEFTFKFKMAPGKDSYLYGAELSYSDDNADNNLSTEVELNPETFNLPAPQNLTMTEDTKTLAWTTPEAAEANQVIMDFEEIASFAVENISDWKNIDLDGNISCTYPVIYDNPWPYSNSQKAWMVWCPEECGQGTATNWLPYAGTKCLIHWGNYGVDADGRTNDKDDDDWFISPEIVGGTDFSFMTAANDLTCAIEVLVSSTTDEPAAFTSVKKVDYAENYSWYNVSVKLPDNAKYVAIRTLHDGFGIRIDNIAYTPARLPKLQGYNIWNNNVFDQYVTELTGKFTADGTYGVSAVYDMGESGMSNKVSYVSGIEQTLAGNVTVIADRGTITVSGLNGENVQIYNVGGVSIASGTGIGARTWEVPTGLYLVKVQDKTCKVLVK